MCCWNSYEISERSRIMKCKPGKSLPSLGLQLISMWRMHRHTGTNSIVGHRVPKARNVSIGTFTSYRLNMCYRYSVWGETKSLSMIFFLFHSLPLSAKIFLPWFIDLALAHREAKKQHHHYRTQVFQDGLTVPTLFSLCLHSLWTLPPF